MAQNWRDFKHPLVTIVLKATTGATLNRPLDLQTKSLYFNQEVEGQIRLFAIVNWFR